MVEEEGQLGIIESSKVRNKTEPYFKTVTEESEATWPEPNMESELERTLARCGLWGVKGDTQRTEKGLSGFEQFVHTMFADLEN